MNDSLSPSLLGQLSAFIEANIGLHYPQERWGDLEKRIRSSAHAAGFGEMRSYAHWLMSTDGAPEPIEALSRQLTIGETYFFRHPGDFDFLETHILRELIHERRKGDRHLRIWSAGCCTGEEPYSIAITLTRLIPDLESWKVSILGTDINPDFLRKAARGVYRRWSIRDTAPWRTAGCFRATPEGDFVLRPDIKELVRFLPLNLASDSYPSLDSGTMAMDVIFCRNVLMYFTAAQANSVARKLRLCLADGGWLVVSPSDAFYGLSSLLTPAGANHASAYRKLPTGAEEAIEAPLAEWLPPQVAAAPSAPLLQKPQSPPAVGEPPPVAAPAAENVTREPLKPYDAAFTLCKGGHYQQAIDALTGPSALSEEDWRAMALLARACANLGDFDQAADWCRKAIAADEFNAGLRLLLATIYEEKQELKASVTALQQALYIDPDFILAHSHLGHALQRMGRSRDSCRYFRNARALLAELDRDALVPESEGLTAGRLLETIAAISPPEAATCPS